VWNGNLIKGSVRRPIVLWREVAATTAPGLLRSIHAVIRERETTRPVERTVHEVELVFDADNNIYMTRAVEPRRALDLRFDPPLLVARGLMRAGDEVDARSTARVVDPKNPAVIKHEGAARQRVQLRQTDAGLELRSELSLDLGLPSMRLRSVLILDITDPAHPVASRETTDVMVKVGPAPVLREKRELTWLGEYVPDP
jgi:hypothetical protein